jgi:hypothetical protein
MRNLLKLLAEGGTLLYAWMDETGMGQTGG